MKHHRKKSIIAALLTLCLITSLSGCKNNSKDETTTSEKNVKQGTDISKDENSTPDATTTALGKGRYLEHTSDPNPEVSGIKIYHVVPEGSSEKVEGKLTLSMYSTTYCLETDGSWTKKELDWIPEDDDEAGYGLESIVMGDDGNEYLLLNKYTKDSGGSPYKTIYQKTGDTVKPVDIPTLYDLINAYRDPRSISPQDFAYFSVTKDGDFILVFGEFAQYLKKNGQVSDICSNINGFASTIMNGKLYALSNDHLSLNIYDIASAELENTISTEGMFSNSYSFRFATLCTDKDNKLYIQCSNGIYELNEATSTFTQIIDGSLTSMSAANESSFTLYKDDDGSFWNVRCDAQYNTFTLYHYIYDPDVSAYPETELTIYSLFDKPEVRLAVVQFQNDNPNIAVKFNPQIIDRSNQDFKLTDYIQALNTELLAGKGPDIIFLDYMNPDNLIEKGILTDITETIDTNSDLYDTIKHTFTKDGKVYAIPTKIEIPVLAGSEEALQAASSLQSLADYSKKSSQKTFRGIQQYTVMSQLYQGFKNEIFDENNNVSIDKIKVFIENMKTINDNCVFLSDDQWVSQPNSIYQLKESISDLGLGIMYNASSTGEVMNLVKESNTKMKVLNQGYYPMNIFSINKNTKNKEAALSFLNVLLSEKMQSDDENGEGIAINKKVVPSKNLTENPMERGGIGWGSYVDSKGVKTEGFVPFPTEEEAKAYVPLYDELKTPLLRDDALDSTLYSSIIGYVNGDMTFDGAVNDINSFLNIYNGE